MPPSGGSSALAAVTTCGTRPSPSQNADAVAGTRITQSARNDFTTQGVYAESLRVSGTDAGLSPAELARIEKAFLESYKLHLKGGGTGIDTAIDLFRAKAAIEALGEAAGAAKGKTGAEKDAAAKAQRTRIESLLADLGLPSRFDLPADALALDPAQLKRFETWLADVVAKREVTPREMLEAAALRGSDAAGPGSPIETVAFVYLDEAQARRDLHELWLRELECWTYLAGRETRIDQDYVPAAPLRPW